MAKRRGGLAAVGHEAVEDVLQLVRVEAQTQDGHFNLGRATLQRQTGSSARHRRLDQFEDVVEGVLELELGQLFLGLGDIHGEATAGLQLPLSGELVQQVVNV